MLYTKDGFNIKPLIDKKTKKPNTSIEKKTRTLLLSTKLSDRAITFIQDYDRWKMIDTLLSRYIKGIEKATRLDGKIHSSFSLSVAATGRSASQNPNLQNIPKRGPLAKVIRKLFVASPGYTFVSADASQCELRFLSFLSQDPVMLEIYRRGEDIHRKTGEAIVGKTKDEMTAEEFKAARQAAKACNFGFIYGSGALTFQRVAKTDYGVNLTELEAQKFKDTFFSTYPTIQDYHQKVKADCHRDNGVISPLGRFRHLPEMALDTWANKKNKEIQSIIHSAERQALNHAIQSVSSDAVLLSCLEIMKVVDPLECRPILFIHDELTYEVRNDLVDKYAPIIKYHMVNPPLKQFGVELNLPLGSDCMVGTSLDNMQEWKGPDLQLIANGENNEAA
jgi:DNA polymerase I-like protein with 3'-5' exonuclease and polymerase domains